MSNPLVIPPPCDDTPADALHQNDLFSPPPSQQPDNGNNPPDPFTPKRFPTFTADANNNLAGGGDHADAKSDKENKVSEGEGGSKSDEESVPMGSDNHDDDENDSLQQEQQEPKHSLRELTYLILEGSNFIEHNKAAVIARVIFVWNVLIIITSCVSFTVETLPSLINKDYVAFNVIEWICAMWFTVDLVLRFLTCPDYKEFALSSLNWIDVLAVLPFYLDLALPSGSGTNGLVMVRILRLTRIVRILKLSKHSIGVQAVAETFSTSVDSLVLLFLLLSILVIIFSSVVYFVESNNNTWLPEQKKWVQPDGSTSAFQSIPDSFWWCVVTITTVGYGDAVPFSAAGKAIASICVVTGVFVIAFPTIILGAKFQEIYFTKTQIHRNKARQHQLAKAKKNAAFANLNGTMNSSGRQEMLISPRKSDIGIVSNRTTLVGIRGGGMPGGGNDMPRISQSWLNPVGSLAESPIRFDYGLGDRKEGRKIFRNKESMRYYFEPLLEFQCSGPQKDVLDIKWEADNEEVCARSTITLTLLLDCIEAQEAARESILAYRRLHQSHRPSTIAVPTTPGSPPKASSEPMFVVKARHVSRLQVGLTILVSSPLVGTTLVTREYSNPTGMVFLTLVLPEGVRVNMVPAFVKDLTFNFTMTYAPEATVHIPLNVYHSSGFRRKSSVVPFQHDE